MTFNRSDQTISFFGIAFDIEYVFDFKPSTGAFRLRDVNTKEPREKIDQLFNDAEGGGCAGCGKKKDAKEKKRTISSVVKGGVGLIKAELGIGNVSKEVEVERKNICVSCPHHDFGVCDECGCYLAAKIKLKDEECPVGKWGRV